MTGKPMTREEYEKQKRLLTADAEVARKALNDARHRYDTICDKLQELRVEWQEQQKAAAGEA